MKIPKNASYVVMGTPVTEEQATEIIVRTDSWKFKNWIGNLPDILRVIGIPVPDRIEYRDRKVLSVKDLVSEDLELVEKLRKDLCVLDLKHFYTERLTENIFGNRRGWCTWMGRVFENYSHVVDLTQKPSELLEDWALIAKAFPFLNLRCQIMDKLRSRDKDEVLQPCLEIKVKEGKASLIKNPRETLDMVPMIQLSREAMFTPFTAVSRPSAETCLEAIHIKEVLERVQSNVKING